MLQGKTILLVDDNRNLVVTLSDYLKSEGFKVIPAYSAEEALEAVSRVIPDLIILDISMPGMGGLGFLRKITQSDGTLTHPVLVMTARGAMQEFFDGIPVEGFITKPCSEEALLEKIRGILGSREAAPAAAEPPGRRVLIAQSEPSIAGEWMHAFRAAGYVVQVVADAQQVLEAVPAFRPHAVVMTEILHGLNGDAVAMLLRAMPSAKQVVIVLCDWTHSPGEGSLRVLRHSAAVDRLVSVCAPGAVLQAVNDLLARGPRG